MTTDTQAATAAENKAKAEKHVLVLRTCKADMTSHAGFKWPEKGLVEAPTEWWGQGILPSGVHLGWKKDKNCGSGLHGLLWGEGDGGLLCWETDAKWLVLRVKASDIVDLNGKVKFPAATVVHCGDQKSATEYLLGHGGIGKRITGLTISAPGYRGTATAGDSGTATAGERGTATAGDSGTATAGDSGTATAGERGTATAGYSGTATAGERGTATAGYSGTATAGDSGTATAGERGTATAGDSGTATAGERGTATAGDSGTATAGYSGTATAGDRGTATAGERGTATAGDSGTATAGYSGTATAGDSGTATAGDRGTATAGDRGTATAGERGTATAGDSGTATAGYSGTATAGDSGVLAIRWWDAKAERFRMCIQYVGENGIKPCVKYRVCEADPTKMEEVPSS